MQKPPPNYQNAHSSQNIFFQQPNSPTANNKSHRESKESTNVLPVKEKLLRVRAASRAPVMDSDAWRTPYKNTKSTRIQNHSTRRRLHQVASWVDEPLILQLKELSRTQRLSMSQTIRSLLKETLRQKFYEQQAATLPEVIGQAVARSHRALGDRIVFFLMFIAIACEQARILICNMLKLILVEVLKFELKEYHKMLDESAKLARLNIITKTPQIKHLITEWEDAREMEEKQKEAGKS
jgi:hypothetical protein